MLVTLYAIFHLSQGAKTKTPASSASYHLFAVFVDLVLIPFYIVLSLNDKWNVTQPTSNRNRWKSLLHLQSTTDMLIQYTWLICIFVAGLHLLTSSFSAWLARMFRKISNLPPDMNPLEDNLTSRRKSKHKHKNSDMSAVSSAHSKHDSGIQLPWEDRSRPVSFIQTRNESTGQLYSPHNPKTASESRTSLPISAPSVYSQPSSDRLSHVSLSQPSQAASRPRSQAPLRAGSPLKQTELTRMNSIAASSVYSEKSDKSAPVLPRKSSKRQSGTFTSTENWYALNDDDEENREPAFSIVEEEDEEDSQIDVNSRRKRPYQPVRQVSDLSHGDIALATSERYAPTPPPKSPVPSERSSAHEPTSLKPLGMNPPTPPPQAADRRSPALASRAGTPSVPLITTSDRSTPTRNSPSPTKGRYYGDLKSAFQGVRNSPRHSPEPKPVIDLPRKEPGLRTSQWLSPARDRAAEKREEREDQTQYRRMNGRIDGHGRVVSRSGADLGDGGAVYFEDVPAEFQDYQGNNARNVSGKVAEEGWGGGWARRRISGR